MKTAFSMLFVGSLLLGLVLTVSGCSRESPEALIASAKANLEKRDFKAAIIQAKNALEKVPDSGEMRFVLGKALLESGEVAPAEVEFRKALDLRHSRDDVGPLLMRTLLFTGQFAKAIEEAPKLRAISGRANAEILTWLAAAHMGRGDKAAARKVLEEALQTDPGSGIALLVSARIKFAEGDTEGALAVLEKTLAVSAADAEAHQLKGDVLLTLGRAEQAVVSYRKAAELRPDLLKMQAALSLGLLTLANFDVKSPHFPEAVKQIDALQAKAPNLPQSLSLAAQVAFLKGELQLAREIAQRLLRATGNAPAALQMAGVIEYRLGAYTLAEAHLSQAVTAAPDALVARRSLVLNRLSAGRPAKAVEAVESVLPSIQENAGMLLVAGQAYMQAGQLKKAEELLARAARLEPDNPRNRTVLAMARMSRGDSNTAIADLEEVSAWDKGTIADMALVASLFRRGDLDRTLAAIEKLEKKLPNDPQPPELRGRVYLAKKDLAGARKSYERALAVSPLYMPAVGALAQMDVDEGKLDAAIKRFEAVLAADAKNVAALAGLASVKTAAKAPADEVVALYSRAIRADPTDLNPRIGLIGYYLDAKERQKALGVARDAAAANPNRHEVLVLLAQAQRAVGDINQSLATYKQVVSMQPEALGAFVQLAELQAESKEFDAAADTLRNALKVKLDFLPAQRALVSLFLVRNKQADALVVAREVQRQIPRDPAGHDLEGDIRMLAKAWKEAIESYRVALRLRPDTETAVKLHRAYGLAGNAAEGDRFADAWTKENPKQASFHNYLAEYALLIQGNRERAVAQFKASLAIAPENASVLNNLAMTLLVANPKEARGYAEKANKLEANNPAYIDTQAMILAQLGETAAALDLLASALKIAPDANAIRFNYARVLAKGGRKENARQELESLAKLGNTFPWQSEVAKLMREL